MTQDHNTQALPGIDLDLDKLEALARSKSKPWIAVKHGWSNVGIYSGSRPVACLSIVDDATEENQEELEAEMDADAAFMVAACNALPALIARARHAAQPSTLTDAQIAAGAAVIGDDGKPIGRNTAIMVADAMAGAVRAAGAADTTASASIDTLDFAKVLGALLVADRKRVKEGPSADPAWMEAKAALVAYIDSRATLAPVAAKQAAAKVEVPVGASVRDMLRWSQANTDYHSLIAFTQAQFDHFVSMVQAAAKAPAAQADFVWPEPPPSKGQSHVLFEDGYAEGWAKAIDTVRSMLAASPASTPEASQDDDPEGKFALGMMSQLHRMGASPAALGLAAQLFGVGPCPKCNYRKLHCRCTPEASQQAAAVAAPSDYVLMPKRLTAENGAKSEFLGEYKEYIQVPCPDCEDCGDDEDCHACENMGTVLQPVTIEWDTIKRIYAHAVEFLAAPTAAAATTNEDARDAALEEAALAAEKVQDDYSERQSEKWPELRDDAATGAGDCATAIRALKSATQQEGGE